MTWLLLAAGGQLLLAVVAILDKYIVTDEKVMPKPFVYAFYSCLMTGGWMVVYLLGFIPALSALGVANIEAPTIQVVGMSFFAAYTLFMALVSMYESLKVGEAADVMPVIGAASALTTFGLSYLLLGTVLSSTFMWGISLLVIGTVLVSQFHFTRFVALHAVHAGLFFGLHFLAMKGLFSETNFDDGFFWSRVSFILFALSLLLVPTYYRKIMKQTQATTKKSGLLVLATKVLAGVGAFMLLKATDWGDVAVVQATDGLKFAFIVIIALMLGRFMPETACKNKYTTHSVVRKIAFIAIIVIGYVLLFQ